MTKTSIIRGGLFLLAIVVGGVALIILFVPFPGDELLSNLVFEPSNQAAT